MAVGSIEDGGFVFDTSTDDVVDVKAVEDESGESDASKDSVVGFDVLSDIGVAFKVMDLSWEDVAVVKMGSDRIDEVKDKVSVVCAIDNCAVRLTVELCVVEVGLLKIDVALLEVSVR